MSSEEIQILVIRGDGHWTVKYDDVVLEYESHARALSASIELAHTFGQEGIYAAVVMGMITSHYGPKGFIHTVPNRRPSGSTKPSYEDVRGLSQLDTLIEVEGSPLVPETPPEIVKAPAEDRRRKLTEEKSPRLLRIASEFAAMNKP